MVPTGVYTVVKLLIENQVWNDKNLFLDQKRSLIETVFGYHSANMAVMCKGQKCVHMWRCIEMEISCFKTNCCNIICVCTWHSADWFGCRQLCDYWMIYAKVMMQRLPYFCVNYIPSLTPNFLLCFRSKIFLFCSLPTSV